MMTDNTTHRGVESLCCVPETKVTLQVNYTLIKVSLYPWLSRGQISRGQKTTEYVGFANKCLLSPAPPWEGWTIKPGPDPVNCSPKPKWRENQDSI